MRREQHGKRFTPNFSGAGIYKKRTQPVTKGEKYNVKKKLIFTKL